MRRGDLLIGAGVLHISAAGDHTNLPVMLAGFLVVATLQAGLGGLLLFRRAGGLVLAGGLALTVGALAAWLVSRTTGLPFLPGGHMEPIGFKDGVTVVFEVATAPLLAVLASSELDQVRLPSPRLGSQAVAVVASGMFVLFVPALVLGGGEHHSHGQLMAHALARGRPRTTPMARTGTRARRRGERRRRPRARSRTGDGLQLADAGSHSGSGTTHPRRGRRSAATLPRRAPVVTSMAARRATTTRRAPAGTRTAEAASRPTGHEHGGGGRGPRRAARPRRRPSAGRRTRQGAPGHEGAEPGHGSGEHGHGGEEPAPPDNGMTGFEDPGTLQWGAHRFDYEPAQPGKDGKVGTGYAMVYRGPSDPNNGTVGHHAHGDCSPTPEQQTAADKLYKETWPAVRKYDNNLYGALADGFTYIFPLTDRIIHMVNVKRVSDPTILDPDQIESFLYVMTDDGLTAVGGMYVMPKCGMPGPQIGGCLTRWHEHAGAAGRLTTAGTSDRTAEMLHVWTYPGLDPWAHYDGRSLSQLSTPGSVVPSVCRETGDASDVCLP